MTEKNDPRLNVKSVTPFLGFIPGIANLNPIYSALIVILLSTYGSIVKMSPSINVLTIIALYISRIKQNLISVKNYYPKLNLPSLNLDINIETITSLMNNLPILHLKKAILSSISVIPLIPSVSLLHSMSL